MATTMTDNYVVGEGSVRLSVKIGDGQIGGTAVKLGVEDVPLERRDGDTEIFEIGLGHEIKGQVLVCVSTVQDIQPGTNHTSVTYGLSGGSKSKGFTMHEEVAPDSKVAYLAVITFV